MKLILLALLLLLLIYYLFVQEPGALMHRHLSPARLMKLVQALYFRGFDGAELIIHEVRHRRRLFRVIKQIVQDNDVRLVGMTTLVPGSLEHCRFVESLTALGVRYDERRINEPSPECTMTIALGNDLAEVCRVARARFEAMDSDVAKDGSASLHNVIERNIRIGWTS